ncbi:glycosyltransferase family 1 protein [Hansschlegelia sp.]|uniref:glycosyltransferase family 4 protein n=1 Tax=Hansschlegelia sp. TaxID=2041892 RepID=UPI002B5D503E|nr:glycosyltransferase family 1 protein [Hansschlegelia sp.]HVI27259.1 glycosyltransferase family 1 protein [Hansschlegelia sp.]
MAEFILAAPGDLETPTGGYLYDARILRELSARGRPVRALALPDGFPTPSAGAIQRSLELLAAVPRDATLVVDGLAFGTLPADKLRVLRRSLAALVHHPLALESGLSREDVERLEISERQALREASAIIVTSSATRRTLIERYRAAPERVHVAEPGVDPAPRAIGNADGPAVILSVGALVPRKNHENLARALALLGDLDWRWRIVGSDDRDPACARRLAGIVRELGLVERVSFLGAVPPGELEDAYADADLFALPSRHEGYGMAYAEALARGLPVIAGDGGAAPELVGPEAGALVEPDDVPGIASALRRLIEDPSARKVASDVAWTLGQGLPRWAHAADVFERLMTATSGENRAA